MAILNLPYIEDDGFMTKELRENLKRASIVYGFMLFIAIGLAYILSKYITRSLQTVTEKITETRLNKRNKKISLQTNTSQEIETLVEAYNGMIDELEVSAAQLASNEREAAWREMAKQVAHEIKNPLTPMRLSVQSFQRKFDPEDPNISEKVQEFSNTLIQQIDTLSSIASAFSTYAKMPAQQDETLDVVTITKLALDIFNEEYIYFFSDEKEIISTFDRTQWIRVITNLVKNSIQAIEKKDPESPRVEVRVFTENQKIFVTVSDNGSGIAEEHKSKVFEPKFTTKSSGMGLGLAMVKNIVETYGGTISLQSVERKGTTFTVCIPLDD
ncbi:MAG: ATP-binding protein [Flavobacteriaceae bacterium]